MRSCDVPLYGRFVAFALPPLPRSFPFDRLIVRLRAVGFRLISVQVESIFVKVFPSMSYEREENGLIQGNFSQTH